MTITTPSVGGRAVLHIKSIKFPETFNKVDGDLGWNIHGVDPHIDIQRTYDATTEKSPDLTSHMQRDVMNLDFGYLTTSDYDHHWEGHSLYRGRHKFQFRVLVEVSDHPETIDYSYHEVNVSVTIGDHFNLTGIVLIIMHYTNWVILRKFLLSYLLYLHFSTLGVTLLIILVKKNVHITLILYLK